MRRQSEKIIPTNMSACFLGGLHLRDLRQSMGAIQGFSTRRRDGFIILTAVERDCGETELFYHDDDDLFVTLDMGQPYERYVEIVTRTVYLPVRWKHGGPPTELDHWW